MPRIAQAFSKSGPPIGDDDTPDHLPGGQQRVVRTPATLAQPLALGAGAVSSVFAAAQAAKRAPEANKRGRARLPAVDVKALQVHVDLPPPFGRQEKGRTKYDMIFDQLTADGMAVTGIPRAYYGGIAKAIEKAGRRLPSGSKLLLRTVDSATLGVWRVKVDEQ